MASIHDVDALIVVGSILWKCVNCDKLLSRHHSIDSHLAGSHRSKIGVHAVEKIEEFLCDVDGCSCQSSIVPRVKMKLTKVMPRSSVVDSIAHDVGFFNSKRKIDLSDGEPLTSDDEDVPQELKDSVEKASMKQKEKANAVSESHNLNARIRNRYDVKSQTVDLCGFHVPVRFMEGDNNTSVQERVPSSDAAKCFKLFQNNMHALNIHVKWQQNGSFLFLNKLKKSCKSENYGNRFGKQKPEALYCGLCAKSFSSKEQFVRHVKLFETVPPILCGNCLCLFHDRFDLHHHQLRTHFKLERSFPCSECSQLLPTLTAAHSHLERHRRKKLMSKQQMWCGSVGTAHTKSHSQKNALSSFRRKKLDAIIKRKKQKKIKMSASEVSNKGNALLLSVRRRKHFKQKTGYGDKFVGGRSIFSSRLCFNSENNQSSPQSLQRPLSKLERNSWNKTLQMEDISARVKNEVKKQMNSSDATTVCNLNQVTSRDAEIVEAGECIGRRRSGRVNKGRNSLYNEYEVEFT